MLFKKVFVSVCKPVTTNAVSVEGRYTNEWMETIHNMKWSEMFPLRAFHCNRLSSYWLWYKVHNIHMYTRSDLFLKFISLKMELVSIPFFLKQQIFPNDYRPVIDDRHAVDWDYSAQLDFDLLPTLVWLFLDR